MFWISHEISTKLCFFSLCNDLKLYLFCFTELYNNRDGTLQLNYINCWFRMNLATWFIDYFLACLAFLWLSHANLCSDIWTPVVPRHQLAARLSPAPSTLLVLLCNFYSFGHRQGVQGPKLKPELCNWKRDQVCLMTEQPWIWIKL